MWASRSGFEARPPVGGRAVERDDVAFESVALLSTVVVPDGPGGTEAVGEVRSGTIEESFAAVEGVESVGRI